MTGLADSELTRQAANFWESVMTDRIALLADIESAALKVREMADKTADPRKRDACLSVADAIEKRARKIDRRAEV